MDMVEHLAGQSSTSPQPRSKRRCGVLEQAYAEMDAEVGATNAATVALKNAIGRLRALRLEIEAK